ANITDVKREFQLQWKEGINIEWGHDIEKDIFCIGYFCADSHAINYFEDELDKELGYFFADLLYAYLYVYQSYTQLSRTYAKFHSSRMEEDAPIASFSGEKVDTA
ncbi:MAG: hypothetical protein RRY29_08520, partial [Desulfovibrionaceae bacterium]